MSLVNMLLLLVSMGLQSIGEVPETIGCSSNIQSLNQRTMTLLHGFPPI